MNFIYDSNSPKFYLTASQIFLLWERERERERWDRYMTVTSQVKRKQETTNVEHKNHKKEKGEWKHLLATES